jgi:hypothetical protein
VLLEQFLQIAFGFPTVIYTVLLGLSLLYWCFVIFGAVDMDMFGGADGAAEGGVEGSVEGVKEGVAEGIKEGIAEGIKEGMAEGLKEGLFEGIKEGIAEGAKEGLAEGMAEGAADGSVEGAKGNLADAAADASFLSNVFAVLKLRSAPVTVVMSLFVLTSWLISSLTMHLGPAALPESVPQWALAVAVLTLGSLVSLVVTSVAVRPLAPIFESRRTIGQHTLVGKELVVLTSDVDERHGQARPLDKDLILSIRCPAPNGLNKGSRALIIDYDRQENVYHVEPMDQFLPNAPRSLEDKLDELAQAPQPANASKEA